MFRPKQILNFVELHPESVFFGRYRSLFLGNYHTDTEGKLGQYFRSKIWREPLKTLAGAPLFPKKGGLRPLFCALRPPFEEKKEFLRNFSKKEFPRNFQKVFPPKLTVQKYRPKIPIPAVSDTG